VTAKDLSKSLSTGELALVLQVGAAGIQLPGILRLFPPLHRLLVLKQGAVVFCLELPVVGVRERMHEQHYVVVQHADGIQRSFRADSRRADYPMDFPGVEAL
jgi:hypothetical protein